MARASLSKRHLALIAALAVPFTVSACYAVAVHAGTNTQLQEVADNAALAGVNSLAASAEQPAGARSAAAIAAAKTVIAANSGIVRSLQPSVDGLTMSVTMEDMDKGTQVSAIARYIPAKDGQTPRQAANLFGYAAASL
ncbi:MAG: hypothetical protein JSS22_06810 [Proteobacteria bacterium]|nr:hypothetical protein [Pseudomonadota bacterium]